MNKLIALGRLLLAVALAALGVQMLLYGDFVPGPLIAPAWLPWRAGWAYLTGAVLAVSGVGLLARKQARLAAVVLCAVLLLLIVFFHAPAPGAVWHDGVARTRAFEALALFGVALVLAGARPPMLGRLVFAVTLIVFGIQHFMYAAFLKTLVPAWIPGSLFWAYFTGVGFIAAGLSIAANVQARLATASLGLMFFLWVVVLHAPRVAANLHDRNEWNSAFVALAMCGASWALSGPKGKQPLPK